MSAEHEISAPAHELRHLDRLREQFDDLTQQREASTLGMWAFLATEVLMFGALFVAFGVYRQAYPAAFRTAGQHLYMSIGSVNTAILLASSFFVAMAVHAAQLGHRRGIAGWLGLAILLGLAFLVLKAVEYYLDWHEEHIFPWSGFQWEGPYPDQARLFFVFYFIMTAIHALHMVIGVGVLSVIGWLGWRGHYGPEYYNPVEVAGLYWHFVDIVWIFLFPTYYLIHPG